MILIPSKYTVRVLWKSHFPQGHPGVGILRIPGPDERNSQHADADHGSDGRAAWVGLTKELVGVGRSFLSVFLPKARSRIKIRGPFWAQTNKRGNQCDGHSWPHSRCFVLGVDSWYVMLLLIGLCLILHSPHTGLFAKGEDGPWPTISLSISGSENFHLHVKQRRRARLWINMAWCLHLLL